MVSSINSRARTAVLSAESGDGVGAVVVPFRVAQTAAMSETRKRYNLGGVDEPPGRNVRHFRLRQGLSQRGLAELCHPALDNTTIWRLENNNGYTQDTLERVAQALGIKVEALFLPLELADWYELPAESRARLAWMVQDAALASKYRTGS